MYGYKLVCCYDNKYSKPVKTYRGKNAVNKFILRMLEEVEYCNKTSRDHFDQDTVMTAADREDFKTTDKCHIFELEYTEKDIRSRARGHCRVIGRYRGSAYQDCNASFRLTNIIPVTFHNLRGYDSHFIMQEIGKFKQDINVIPNNMEKYMAFMLGKHLVFLDSFQFMSSGLDKLASNLPRDAFEHTGKMFN